MQYKLYSVVFSIILSLNAFAFNDSNPSGSYSEGSIQNSVSLSSEGNGYMRLFVDRDRGWGSLELVSLIIETAAEMNQLYPDRDRLQVGDLGAQNGGLISRHGSHQNGLDVDLTYYRNNGLEQRPQVVNGFSELMVRNGKLSKNFDIDRNWVLMKNLHKYGDVQRIFVDPIIKKALCKHAQVIGELPDHSDVLRSLRPYANHADHLHVRLYCPADSSDCIAQEEVPEGSGC